MVKKLKYLIFLLIFLFTINVNASTVMPSPTSFQLQKYDNTSNSYGVRQVGWYNVVSYGANINYGGTYGVSDENVTRWNIWYSNSNICLNKSATLYITINSYYSPFNTSQSPIMNYTSFLRAYNGTTDYTCSLNQSLNQGKTTTWTCNIIGTQNLLLHLETDMPSDTVYGFSVGTDSNYVCDTTADVSSSINNSTQNIINNQNSNSQNIINNQNSNTNSIINNQNSNTNQITQNQNQNTQNVINNQNETFGNVCYNNFFSPNFSDYTTSGAYLIKNLNTVDKLLNINFIDKDTSVNVSGINVGFSYDTNPNNGFIWSMSNGSINSNLSNITTSGTNSGVKASYIMIYPNTQEVFNKLTSRYNIQIVEGSETRPFIPYGETKCINKLDEQTDAINGLNNTISSEASPDTQNELNDLDNSLISDTPITDLITLPITLLNSYINGFSGTCSPYNLGNLYGTDLILPCINLQQRLGSTMWTTIDALFSIFLIYNLAMLFIQAFEGFTSLRDDYEGLYQPKHADTGYQPKHGGDS